MGRFTIKLLQRVTPEKRLIVAAYLFWFSIIAGITCTALVHGFFQQVLMAISWFAVTVTCVDVIFTADVRATEEDL